MSAKLPRIVTIGGAQMLVFRDTDGHVQMIATDRLDGANRHKTRFGASVLIVERDDGEGGQIIIPADHSVEDLLALGVKTAQA